MQDGWADVQEGSVRGRRWGLGAPDYAVEDGRGHEGAVEEGRVGHCFACGCGGQLPGMMERKDGEVWL